MKKPENKTALGCIVVTAGAVAVFPFGNTLFCIGANELQKNANPHYYQKNGDAFGPKEILGNFIGDSIRLALIAAIVYAQFVNPDVLFLATNTAIILAVSIAQTYNTFAKLHNHIGNN